MRDRADAALGRVLSRADDQRDALWHTAGGGGLCWLLAVALLIPLACHRTGGSGPGQRKTEVVSLSIGRGVETPDGLDVVSPLTYAQLDPDSGLAVRETVRPIDPAFAVEALIRFPLRGEFHPPVVPRNGILVLGFSERLDPESVRADRVGPDGEILEEGSIQIRALDGRALPVTLTVRGSEVLINPLGDDRTGFPASPIVYDAQGEATTYPEGAAFIRFPSKKRLRPRSRRGEPLRARHDGLGEEATPIGFTPGNRELDFIARNSILPLQEGFNGYLPDDEAPRIVRRHHFDGQLDFASGDRASAWSLTDADAGFDGRANGGRGEWADAELTVRPGAADEQTVRVVWNTRDQLTTAEALLEPMRDGEEYRLSRIEQFEPDPLDPIDPDRYDPLDPQNEVNADLLNFITVRELDENGLPVGPVLDAHQVLPPRVELSVLFSEPMDPSNLLLFENFMVRRLRSGTDLWEKLPGAIVLEEHAHRATFRPVLTDADGRVNVVHGLGPDAGRYWLDLVTVPSDEYLVSRFPNEVVMRIRDEGYRALTDLGGNPLAFPGSWFDAQKDRLVYRAALQSEGWSDGTTVRALVHTFRGRPEGEFDPDSNEFMGVWFRDHRYSYGKAIADFNLQTRGVLTGSALRFFQKVFDEENPSTDGLIQRNGTFPFGAATPLGGFQFTDGLAYSGIFGARFQHLYRNEDISPAPGARAFELSLWRISWAPSGGYVTDPPDVYENVSIHVAHSDKRPIGSPSFWNSLDQAFDPQYYEVCCFSLENTACDGSPSFHTNGPNYIPPLVTTVETGTAYSPSNDDLFVPETTSRQYLSWPVFDHLFGYDNEHSLLIEYRIRPQATLISFANAFTFSLAYLNRKDPMFRIYSLGSYGNSLDPDNMNDPRVQCAEGPQSGKPHYGDNAVYYMLFDWVKAVSNIECSFGDSHLPAGKTIEWLEPLIMPPLDELPFGTEARFEYQGAHGSDGEGASAWVDDPRLLGGYRFGRFRVRLVGHIPSRSVPSFDAVALPYRVSD